MSSDVKIIIIERYGDWILSLDQDRDKTSSICWAQLNRLCMKTETESSL
jgi:hypothetical protein